MEEYAEELFQYLRRAEHNNFADYNVLEILLRQAEEHRRILVNFLPSAASSVGVGYKTPYPIPIPSRFYPSQFSILCSIGSLSVEFHYLVFPKII